MEIGSILILLSIFVLAGFIILRPLLEKQAIAISEDEQAYSTLMAERDRILEALEELEFDYNLGKIPDADFPRRRAVLYQQGAEILKQLDDYESRMPRRVSPQDDLIEAAIQARRQDEPAAPLRQPVREDDDIETMLAARRREKLGQSGGFCPQCGQAYQKSDKFCSKCGAVLS